VPHPDRLASPTFVGQIISKILAMHRLILDLIMMDCFSAIGTECNWHRMLNRNVTKSPDLDLIKIESND
jgi:hypothetical protein